ncbi:Transcription-repair-coupling factor [Ureibacillus acetophenoni]
MALSIQSVLICTLKCSKMPSKNDKVEKVEEKAEIEIILHTDAYIPDSYIPDGYQKIQMYKRIKSMDRIEDYNEIFDEMIDRFGNLPDETVNLLRIVRMKVWAIGTRDYSYKRETKSNLDLYFRRRYSKSRWK